MPDSNPLLQTFLPNLPFVFCEIAVGNDDTVAWNDSRNPHKLVSSHSCIWITQVAAKSHTPSQKNTQFTTEGRKHTHTHTLYTVQQKDNWRGERQVEVLTGARIPSPHLGVVCQLLLVQDFSLSDLLLPLWRQPHGLIGAHVLDKLSDSLSITRESTFFIWSLLVDKRAENCWIEKRALIPSPFSL